MQLDKIDKNKKSTSQIISNLETLNSNIKSDTKSTRKNEKLSDTNYKYSNNKLQQPKQYDDYFILDQEKYNKESNLNDNPKEYDNDNKYIPKSVEELRKELLQHKQNKLYDINKDLSNRSNKFNMDENNTSQEVKKPTISDIDENLIEYYNIINKKDQIPNSTEFIDATEQLIEEKDFTIHKLKNENEELIKQYTISLENLKNLEDIIETKNVKINTSDESAHLKHELCDRDNQINNLKNLVNELHLNINKLNNDSKE